jgi:hypothetical protein
VLARVALLDMEIALSASASWSIDDQDRAALRDMCELLEADSDSPAYEVLPIRDDGVQHGTGAAQDAKAIAAEARAVAVS